MLFTLLAFAVALGLLITFHELGHYWVARWFGVRIERFSIGFGRVIARRVDRHGTEWALSAIPLGGYVKMLNEPAPGASAVEAEAAFDHKPLAQRAAIVAAGPLANFVLAAALYAVLGLIGAHEPLPVLAPPATDSVAARAGLSGGEQVIAINNREVQSWPQLRWALLDVVAGGGRAVLQAQDSSGRMHDYELDFADHAGGFDRLEDTDPLMQAGLELAPPRALISQVLEGEAGALSGLLAGDIVVRADTVDTPSPAQLVDTVSAQAGQAVSLTVLRDDALIDLVVTPREHTDEHNGRIGRIGVMLAADYPMTHVRHGLGQSAWLGMQRTVETAWFSVKMLGRMLTGRVSMKTISGPVTIADYAGQTARSGLVSYLGFVALISVSIGVLNLLPIPLLDGGHLMFQAIEAVRGSPPPQAWLEYGQRIGLALLAALMGLAFFNDFVRLFT